MFLYSTVSRLGVGLTEEKRAQSDVIGGGGEVLAEEGLDHHGALFDVSEKRLVAEDA